MGRTIEMYQDPKDEIYYSLRDLVEKYRGKIVYVEGPSFQEKIAICSIVAGFETLRMPDIGLGFSMQKPHKFNESYSSKKYSSRRETMSKEIKHIARRYHGRGRK